MLNSGEGNEFGFEFLRGRGEGGGLGKVEGFRNWDCPAYEGHLFRCAWCRLISFQVVTQFTALKRR